MGHSLQVLSDQELAAGRPHGHHVWDGELFAELYLHHELISSSLRYVIDSWTPGKLGYYLPNISKIKSLLVVLGGGFRLGVFLDH